jgi:hypothetical protein
MSDSIIRAELESRLATWANAQTPKIPVAYEAVPFTKPTSGVFLEAELHPAITLDRSVGGYKQRYLGIFQVNCWAKSGRGMAEVETLAKNIISLFPMLPKQGNVSVEATPYTEHSILDSAGWVIIPVTIKYRYDT